MTPNGWAKVVPGYQCRSLVVVRRKRSKSISPEFICRCVDCNKKSVIQINALMSCVARCPECGTAEAQRKNGTTTCAATLAIGKRCRNAPRGLSPWCEACGQIRDLSAQQSAVAAKQVTSPASAIGNGAPARFRVIAVYANGAERDVQAVEVVDTDERGHGMRATGFRTEDEEFWIFVARRPLPDDDQQPGAPEVLHDKTGVPF